MSIISSFRFGRWDVTDRLQEPSVVEPIDPGEGGQLHGLAALPRLAGSALIHRVSCVSFTSLNSLAAMHCNDE